MHEAPLENQSHAKVKLARVLDGPEGGFSLDYENTLGKKLSMRLEASSYEGAIREAKAFLEIGNDSHDVSGSEWDLE